MAAEGSWLGAVARLFTGTNADRTSHGGQIDSMIPAETRDAKEVEAASRREQTKQRLRDLLARLQVQEKELNDSYQRFMQEVAKRRRANRLDEARTLYQRAQLFKVRLEKNRSNQCAAEKRLLDIDALETDALMISAFKDTTAYMRDSTKHTAKPEDVQDMMVEMTETQAEQEMVSELIAAAADMDLDCADDDFDTWMKQTEQQEKSTPQKESVEEQPEKKARQKKKKKGNGHKYDQLKAIADDL